MGTLGKALRQRRGDLSQRAAARELGVAVQTYIYAVASQPEIVDALRKLNDWPKTA